MLGWQGPRPTSESGLASLEKGLTQWSEDFLRFPETPCWAGLDTSAAGDGPVDDSEGHTNRPLRLCVELPTEMIIQPVSHIITCVPHSVQDHVRPRTVCRVTLLTPQVPQKWFGVSSGQEAP